jgi:hypothetical protein
MEFGGATAGTDMMETGQSSVEHPASLHLNSCNTIYLEARDIMDAWYSAF